ncbi:unnamed protein product [Parajaminaea phylloscopi]
MTSNNPQIESGDLQGSQTWDDGGTRINPIRESSDVQMSTTPQAGTGARQSTNPGQTPRVAVGERVTFETHRDPPTRGGNDGQGPRVPAPTGAQQTTQGATASTAYDDDRIVFEYNPYIPSNDPDLSPADNAFLSGIQIGCFNDQETSELNKVLNYVRFTVPKLERKVNGVTTYYLWLRYAEQALHLFGRNRVLGFINGTIEGSVQAYQRYYGIPPINRDDGFIRPELLSKELALQKQREDDMRAAAALMASFDTSVHPLLLGDSINHSSIKCLWKTIRDKCVPSGPTARNMVQNMIIQYTPGNKSVETIIHDLRQLYFHYYTTRGKAMDEEDKISHLLRCLPSFMNDFKTTVNYHLEGDNSVDFEHIATRAVSQAQTRYNEEMQRQYIMTPTMGHQPQFPVTNQQQNLIGYAVPQHFPNPLGGLIQGRTDRQPSRAAPQPQQQSTVTPAITQGQPDLSTSPTSSIDSGGPRTPSPTQALNAPAPRRFPVICYWCGEEGHIAPHCPRQAAGEPKTYVPRYQRDAAAAQQANVGESHNTQPQHVSSWAGQYPAGLGDASTDLEGYTF